MSQDTEAKIHIGGYSKTKERILGEYGDGMRLNWSCEGWGQVKNMIRGEKRKSEVTQGLGGCPSQEAGVHADLLPFPSPGILNSHEFSEFHQLALA